MKSKILLVIPFLFTLNANAQITESDIDDIITSEMIRQNLPGLAVGVYQKGMIEITKGYGHIDLDRTVPIDDKTIFRWASISKTLTAIAALKLMEINSNISISSLVTNHYPYWTEPQESLTIPDLSEKSKIRIRHLLTNRSGIAQYGEKVWDERESYKTDDGFNANSSVDAFKFFDLDANPGQEYKYSTQGFVLLGAVIDEVSDEGYPEFVYEHIEKPLGMPTLNISNGTFIGFQKSIDGIINTVDNESVEWVLPGGGWESNIKDLLTFAKEGILEKNILLNTERLWASDGYNEDNKPQAYKRGVWSFGTNNNLRVLHGGNHENLTSNLYIMPNRDIAIVLMIPMESADRNNITYRIVNKFVIPNIYKANDIETSPRDKCTSKMESSDKKFAGVWRKTTEDVLIRRGYSRVNFNKEYKFLRSNGYYLEDIEADKTDDGKILWNGIFKTGKGIKSMSLKLNLQEFREKWDRMNSMGLHLYDLETYVVNNKRYWAGLFRKETGKSALWRNFSASNFAVKKEEMKQLGLKLIDMEVYESGGELKWSGVWIPGDDGFINRDYNKQEFKNLISAAEKNGNLLIDIETYLKNGIQKWAGIWGKSAQRQLTTTGLLYCSFMNNHDNNSASEYELIDMESYQD